MINHQPLIRKMKSDITLLKEIFRRCFLGLDILAQARIVHSDLKPDNILIKWSDIGIQDIKLIDWGSSFDWETCNTVGMATPE